MMDQELVSSVSTFKKLYDDFIRNNYLFVYSMVRNKVAAIRIMQSVFESIFIVDTYRLLQTVIRVESYAKTLKFSQEYVTEHASEIDQQKENEKCIEYPRELEMFKFNTSVFHNSRINTIVILRIIYNLDFKDIARYVNISCEQVISEYIMVMERIKNTYKEKKKFFSI